MTRALLVAALLVSSAACSKKRIAECDDFVATSEKLSKCDKLPAEQRETVAAGAKQIKDMLKMADDAGGFDDAPKEVVDELRSTCKSMNNRVVAEMQKTFPDCLQ